MQTKRPSGKQGEGSARRRVGLALAGGGALGGMYEVGALLALDEALEGVDLHQLDAYVGVSSGALLAATLANQYSLDEIARLAIECDRRENCLSAEVLYQPAFNEYGRRLGSVPVLLLGALRNYLANPVDLSLLDALTSLSRAIPTGLFDSEPLRQTLARLYGLTPHTDDFRELHTKLFVVAANLDTGESIKFGAEGYDQVPISKAVQASASLPGLYPPVEINGQYYVDGALLKTLHASVALDEGVDLIICINPIVPYDSKLAARRGTPKHGKLVAGGLPVVLSQTFRTLIHSRLRVGISKYYTDYEDADVVLIEPDHDDSKMFFANVFSYSGRRSVCEHAYAMTRRQLLARRGELEPVFARNGLTLRADRLEEDGRPLDTMLGSTAPCPSGNKTLNKLRHTLDQLADWVASAR